MSARIRPEVKALFERELMRGAEVAAAARTAGVSYAWAKAHARGLRSNDQSVWETRRNGQLRGPIAYDSLKPEAKEALENIDYFALRYFGLILMPWQVEATGEITELLETPVEEYACLNVAPGTGKSTFFTMVLPAWVTARNRAIRGLIGSAATHSATWYTNRLRTALSRTTPVKAKANDLRLGIATDAVATLAGDFGRFKPMNDEKWASDAFVVAQFDDVALSEKEPTWSAFGRQTSFIGYRADLCIWDDAYDPTQVRTAQARADLNAWWEDIAENRLEPGGLLLLQGQRMGPDDLYAHALSLRQPVDIDDDGEIDELTGDEAEAPRKYHHIRFRAHYEDRCRGTETHRLDAPAYPEGCLLYPRRLPWKKLQAVKASGSAKFEVIYQQEDVDPAEVLVQKVWVSGGVDPLTGEQCMGCWDTDRGLCELPSGLQPPFFSIATADPSPTQFWGVQWWVYHPASEQRFLMDLVRKRMGANDLLDWDHDRGAYTGLMQDWQVRAKKLGIPIGWWIFEQNVAQRFVLQFQHTWRWRREHGVAIIGHETAANKADPELGVSSIGSHWRFGRVRLPGKQGISRVTSLRLVDEVTVYPESRTTDQVMAEWFLEWNLPRLAITEAKGVDRQRPGWASRDGLRLVRPA